MDAPLRGWHASTLSSEQLLWFGARVVICLPATPRLAREALGRQEASVQELLVVRRVPAAYKQCLAECVRRCGHGSHLRGSESSRTAPCMALWAVAVRGSVRQR